MSIDALFEMKEKPGVVVVGRKNATEEQVFDDVIQRLSDFYDTRKQHGAYAGPDLVFVSRPWDSKKKKVYCPVYISEVPEMQFKYDGTDENGEQAPREVSAKEARLRGNVKVEKIKQEDGVKWCGLAQGRWEYTQDIFAVYFNMNGPLDSESDKHDFSRYFGCS